MARRRPTLCFYNWTKGTGFGSSLSRDELSSPTLTRQQPAFLGSGEEQAPTTDDCRVNYAVIYVCRISDGRSVEPSDGNVFGGDGADSSIVIENHVNYDYYPTSPSQPIDADGNIDMTSSSGPFDDAFGQGRPTRPSLDDNRPISDLGGFDNRPVNNLDVFDNRPVNDYDNDYDSRPINSFDSDYENFFNRPNDQRPSVIDARLPGSKPPRLPIIIETSVGIGPQSWKSERPRPPITPTPPRRPITTRPPRRPVTPRPPRPLTPRPATPRPPRPRPGPTDNLPSGGGTHITFFGRSDSEPRRFRKDRAQPTYRG